MSVCAFVYAHACVCSYMRACVCVCECGCVDEKGSSSWLTVLPLKEHGFHFHMGEFRDAISLRYR